MKIHAPAQSQAYREAGFWSDLRLQDLLARNASAQPQAEAVVDPPNLASITGDPPQRLSWSDFARRVEQLAAVLLAQGLQRDDVVLVQMANTHELLAVYLACARLGVIASPIVTQAREHELSHAVSRTAAVAFIVTARIGTHDHVAMAFALARTHTTVRSVMAFGSTPLDDEVVDLRAPMQAGLPSELTRVQALARHEALHPVTADDAVTMLWTSGSEGHAKAVARTHNDWLLYGPHIGAALGVGPGARLLSGRPLTTHGAFVGSIVPWLWHGGALVLHQPFSLPVFLQQLRTERIDFTALAPAILSSLLTEPERLEGIDFQRLKCIGSGSAPLTEALVRGFKERFGVEVINFFGSTEGASLVSSPQDMPDPALRAQYFPRFGVPGMDWAHPAHRQVRTRLVDLATQQTIEEPGRVGELRYQGPMVMTGYVQDPDLTAQAFDEQGFYRSGDLFEIAGEGGRFFRFCGRVKDIIIRGGFNLSAQEIENLVASHPAVADVAVVGYPDERLGERVCACVVLRPGHQLSLIELTRHLREVCHASALKLPERLLCLAQLPRSPNNKVIKSVLRHRAAAGASDPAQPSFTHQGTHS
jgi:acyl-CoA synthetase (AMP-forming)/AMP-acid ligase II